MDTHNRNFTSNKTSRFLAPCLRDYGPDFTLKFNAFNKIAIGISDDIWRKVNVDNSRVIFILCDTTKYVSVYLAFLSWIKEQPYYVDDYCPGSSLLNSTSRMVVIRIPECHQSAYDQFLLGNYSKMYTEDKIVKFFSDPHRRPEFYILTLNPAAIPSFLKSLNSEFLTEKDLEDPKNRYTVESIGEIKELELPGKHFEEVFNSSKNCFITNLI